MRDHRKLRAFELADALAMAVHGATRAFPAEERFGLALQMRRAAVEEVSKVLHGLILSLRARSASAAVRAKQSERRGRA